MNDDNRRKDRLTNDHDTLIRVEAKVDNLITDLKRQTDTINFTNSDYGIRIVKIEMWQRDFRVTWKLMVTAATTIGAIVGILAQLFAGVLSKH